MSEFDAIRPYNDDEVVPTLERLLADREFVDTVTSLVFPRASRIAGPFIKPVVKSRLRKETTGIDTVERLQLRIRSYLKRVLDTTIDSLTVSGLGQLDSETASLFVSNHRDIVMDPALVNWVLHEHGFSTLRIAIGDNLLSKPFAADLMRLNKSFIVNRSAKGPREKLKAAKLLSKYIHHSVKSDNENVWIAQREGRAKDGIDVSNPAIISMFALSRDKSMPFADYIGEARIVPVSISYEYDPCGEAKAREVYEIETHGSYTKAEHEDAKSIATGITGYKGNVHIHFGQPFNQPFENSEQVKEKLDAEIIRNYVLHPSNCIAYEMLEKKTPKVAVGASGERFEDGDWSEQRKRFSDLIATCNSRYLEHLLKGYANPVYRKLAMDADA